jgi:hypothetical protein
MKYKQYIYQWKSKNEEEVYQKLITSTSQENADLSMEKFCEINNVTLLNGLGEV